MLNAFNETMDSISITLSTSMQDEVHVIVEARTLTIFTVIRYMPRTR